MALHPELLPYLGGPATADLDHIATSRDIASALTLIAVAERPALPPDLEVTNHVATGSDGYAVGVRVYRGTKVEGRRGALLFVHGGAFVFGDLELEHDRCLTYARDTDVVIVAVDYRLAPEHRYPTALHDVDTALTWLLSHADELSIDTARVGVGGASAGGALAAALTLWCRDRGGPALAAQLLLYPALDDRGQFPSLDQYEHGPPWDGRRSRQMWSLYLPEGESATPYAAPARADNLSGLPPTLMVTCEEDPLRDEDLDYVERLRAADVAVVHDHYPSAYHAFDVIAISTALAQGALANQCDFLQRTLGTVQSQGVPRT
jgi:dienelactone hydrolase